MTPNPTKTEISSIEEELREQSNKRERHVRRAVNPKR